MNRQIILLILIFWTSSFAFSQDFYFRWQFYPSLSKSYTAKIEKRNSENCIIIKGTYSNDSIVKKISNDDCNLLEEFLIKYDFPNIIITQGNVISTDGHIYEGEYTKSDIKRKYIIYSTNVSKLDCELNKIIYSFLVKYDTKNKYSRVKRYIDMDESIN
jgi:hypothetical protein